jgi:hypothetical protein
MRRATTLLTLALFLTASGICWGETLVNTDFSKGSTGWVLNQDAQLETFSGRQVLSLTRNEGSQTGVAWTDVRRRVPSFSFIADIRVRFDPPSDGACPADGMTLAYADTSTSAVGGGGGNLGLFNNPDEIGTFIALDINTWYGQGLGGGRNCHALNSISETIAFAVMKKDCSTCLESPESGRSGDNAYDRHTGVNSNENPERGGMKLGQSRLPQGMKIVNGGTYRYQWNVDGATNTMTCYVTGLDDNNKQFQKVKVTEIKSGVPVLDFEGRWGLTAATGGAVQWTDVFNVRIDVPMIEPL